MNVCSIYVLYCVSSLPCLLCLCTYETWKNCGQHHASASACSAIATPLLAGAEGAQAPAGRGSGSCPETWSQVPTPQVSTGRQEKTSEDKSQEVHLDLHEQGACQRTRALETFLLCCSYGRLRESHTLPHDKLQPPWPGSPRCWLCSSSHLQACLLLMKQYVTMTCVEVCDEGILGFPVMAGLLGKPSLVNSVWPT